MRLAILHVAWLCLLMGVHRSNADVLFVAGGDGIYSFEFAPDSGRLSAAILASKIESACSLAAHPTGWFLVATSNDGKSGSPSHVVSFFVNPNRGTVDEIGRVETGGASAADVEVDARRGAVFVANDKGGGVAGFPLGVDGKLGARAFWIKHEGSSVVLPRQAEPHPCQVRISPDGRYVYVPDLGTDEIFIYAFGQDGVLHPASTRTAKVGEGEGPYHLDFHPRLPMVYLTCEISSRITVFQRDVQSGGLTAVQSIGTVPHTFRGKNACGEIRVHPSGEFVYASNQGQDSLAVYRADEQGFLSLAGFQPTGGKTPRAFAIHPSGKWLIAGNQGSSNLVVFSINAKTGLLTPTGESVPVWAPACLVFAPAP